MPPRPGKGVGLARTNALVVRTCAERWHGAGSGRCHANVCAGLSRCHGLADVHVLERVFEGVGHRVLPLAQQRSEPPLSPRQPVPHLLDVGMGVLELFLQVPVLLFQRLYVPAPPRACSVNSTRGRVA